MNSGAENFGGAFALGQFLDLLGVEEKQMCDAAGNVALDVFIPMFAQQGIIFGLAGDLDVFLDALGSLTPSTSDAIRQHIAIHGPAEAKLDGRAIGGIGTAMNHVAQIFAVAEFTAPGAAGLGPVKHQLDGIEQGGFAATIHATKEDDGATRVLRCQHRLLTTAEDAKIFEGDGIENHGRRLGWVSQSCSSVKASARSPLSAAARAPAWRRAMSVASATSS